MTVSFCDTCNKQVETIKKEQTSQMEIHGKPIEFVHPQVICTVCGSPVFDEEVDSETMRLAMEAYRSQYGMQPEEILAVRQQYKSGGKPIPRELFAKLLQVGESTVRKRELGNVSLDTATLHLYMDLQKDPGLIRNFYNLQKEHLEEPERSRVENFLAPYLKDRTDADYIESLYAPYGITAVSGYTKLQFEKLKHLVSFFARRGVVSYQLWHLLWLADQHYFAQQTVGISGLVYVRTAAGPAPLDSRLLLAHLERAGVISVDETVDEGGWNVLRLTALQAYDKNAWEPEEDEVIRMLDERFIYANYAAVQHYTATIMADNWSKAAFLEPVSYVHAIKQQNSYAAPAVASLSGRGESPLESLNNLCYLNVETGEVAWANELKTDADLSSWIQIAFYDEVQLSEARKTYGLQSEAYQRLVRSIYERALAAQEDQE